MARLTNAQLTAELATLRAQYQALEVRHAEEVARLRAPAPVAPAYVRPAPTADQQRAHSAYVTRLMAARAEAARTGRVVKL